MRVIDEGFEDFVSVWCFLLRALGPSFNVLESLGSRVLGLGSVSTAWSPTIIASVGHP